MILVMAGKLKWFKDQINEDILSFYFCRLNFTPNLIAWQAT